MQKYFELTSALEYIEDHMLDNCSQADIAHAACVSLSALQKMFRFTFGYSINDNRSGGTVRNENPCSGSCL